MSQIGLVSKVTLVRKKNWVSQESKLDEVSFEMLELGEASFGILKLDKLGELWNILVC